MVKLTKRLEAVWVKISAAIAQLPKHDSIVLQSLAPLIISGLDSKKKAIAAETVQTWNDTFGQQDSLDYPASLRKVVKKLRQIADLRLPGFPEDSEEVCISTPLIIAALIFLVARNTARVYPRPGGRGFGYPRESMV